MAEIQHGKISELAGPVDSYGNNTRARVVPATADQEVSDYLTIPEWLRGDAGPLELEEDVVYVLFDDLEGLILCRTDGTFGRTIYGDLTIKQGDLITDGVPSYNQHKHGYTHGGESTGPDVTEGPQ